MSDEISEYLKQVVLGDPAEHREIVLVDYDPEWPQRFHEEAAKIRSALPGVVVGLEHIGSTSVPGLAAKPIIDILLVVQNSGDEHSYVAALEQAGYELRVREPDFDEHRMLRTPRRDVHTHVFSSGSGQIDRLLLFRDHLRRVANDRRRYEDLKRELASQPWATMQHYAEAKTDLIEELLARARAGEHRAPVGQRPALDRHCLTEAQRVGERRICQRCDRPPLESPRGGGYRGS